MTGESSRVGEGVTGGGDVNQPALDNDIDGRFPGLRKLARRSKMSKRWWADDT